MADRRAASALAAWVWACVGCTALLDLDGYSAATSVDGGTSEIRQLLPDGGAVGPAVAVFDHYRFERGDASFEVAAPDGLLANDAARAIVAGRFATRAGGGIDIAADGSFRYTPPGEAGAFWGDDGVEYQVAGAPAGRARVRLTVAAPTFDLRQPIGSGAGFGVLGGAIFDSISTYPAGVDAAGDVNGDGFEDIVIAVPGPTFATDSENLLVTGGRGACVVFGKADSGPVSLSQLETGSPRGFAIASNGDEDTDSLGFGVAGAGDVNGDGFDDVIVSQLSFAGEADADPSRFAPFGASYVVFGKRDGAPVDPVALRAGQGGGFAILGAPEDWLLGFAVDAAGDVNGDGLGDVVVSAPIRAGGIDGVRGPGSAFVVFGKLQTDPVRLETLAEDGRGFELHGELEGEGLGLSVAGIGDINGDGLDDVAITSVRYPSRETSRGRVGVVFGKRDTSPVSIAALVADTTQGFVLDGADDGDAGFWPQRGGDINGDGFDDLVIGAPFASFGPPVVRPVDAGADDAGSDAGGAGSDGALSASGSGIVYVLYGAPSLASMSLRALEAPGHAGFSLGAEQAATGLGNSVSAGDMNGDGFSDVLIGAAQGLEEGRAYLLLGSGETSTLTLPAPPEPTPRPVYEVITAAAEGTGNLVASGADVNADGVDDLLFGVPLYPGAPQAAGGVYVAYGWDIRDALGERDRALIGTIADDVLDLPLEPIVIARGGNGSDTLRVGPRTAPLDLRERGRYESIEVIDVRGGGPQLILIDDAAVRRLPQNQPGFAFSLARRLTILGDADDTLRFDMTGYASGAGNAGRAVYRREGRYYGLELSRELRVEAP